MRVGLRLLSCFAGLMMMTIDEALERKRLVLRASFLLRLLLLWMVLMSACAFPVALWIVGGGRVLGEK